MVIRDEINILSPKKLLGYVNLCLARLFVLKATRKCCFRRNINNCGLCYCCVDLKYFVVALMKNVGDDKATCSKCKERRKCTKSLSIHKSPKILVTHLNKCSQTEKCKSKLNVNIDSMV